jgi:Zn-dependent membrane protease YugP
MDLFIVYGLMLISLIITLGAQVYVNSSYNKYRKIRNKRGITGSDAARTFLDRHGMSDVKIGCVKGTLSDHYDPRSKTVNLSREIYSGTSIAAVSVACHECGHALQDKTNYSFMRIRASLVPVTRFASYAGYIAIALGAALGAFGAI